ncbi:MAG: ATP-binding protein [Steroidobacteraceae bacterium]|jgi:two-component system sensor kinase FixL
MVSHSSTTQNSGKPVRAGPWVIGLYFISHVILDAVSYVQPVLKLGITPLSPQTGLVLAFLYAYRGNFWWVAGAFFVSEIVIRGIPMQVWILPLQAISITGVYQLAAWLLRSKSPMDSVTTLNGTLKFIAIASATAITAGSVSVGLYTLASLVPAEQFASALARFWVGDLNGILLLTPLLLRFTEAPLLLRALVTRPAAFAGVSLGLLASFTLVFLVGNPGDLRFFYLFFVPAISAALIWGIPGFLLAALALQISLVVGVQRLSEVAPLVDLQFLMSTLLVTGLALGAVVTERENSARLALRREKQLRDSEANLARASRAATTGELASTLAHELNQPMTALVSYLRASEIMMADGSRNDARLAPTLRKAADEALRASDILRRLRNFYAGRDPQLESLELSPIVEKLVEALRRSERTGVESIVLRMDPALPNVHADRVFIEVILSNLIANALDATAERPDPVIEITAHESEKSVHLSVDDNGRGMSEQIRRDLFKAFVTSKSDGLGVGLAVSRSLAEACGGELHLAESSLGGAKFEFVLPIDTERRESP